MTLAYEADLVLPCASAEEAAGVAGALGVEAGQDLPKARSTVRAEGPEVHVTIEARDAVSLRAAVNSYLRWARVAVEASRAGRA